MPNLPDNSHCDPRKTLVELRKKLEQKARNHHDSYLKDDPSQPVFEDWQPYQDPLGDFFHRAHDVWLALKQRLDHERYRDRLKALSEAMRAELRWLNDNSLMEKKHLSSTEVSPLKLLIKKMLFRLLRPIAEYQALFNSHLIRFCNALSESFDLVTEEQHLYDDYSLKVGNQLLTLTQKMQVVRDRIKSQFAFESERNDRRFFSLINDLFTHVNALRREISDLQENWENKNEDQMRTINAALQLQQKKIDAISTNSSKKRAGPSQESPQESPAAEIRFRQHSMNPSDKTELDWQIEAFFESTFRGQTSDITARQRWLLPYFEKCKNVIDIGCGRGEFLDLMKDIGVRCTGLEINPILVTRCEEKGHTVICENGLSYLKNSKDNLFDGIFCSQVVEHIPASQRTTFLRLAFDKLVAGGVLAMETVNPMSLFALSSTYFLDWTHDMPVHPHTLQFLMKQVGFREIELHFLHPVEQEKLLPLVDMNPEDQHLTAAIDQLNETITQLNSLLFGYQDFAVIAHK